MRIFIIWLALLAGAACGEAAATQSLSVGTIQYAGDDLTLTPQTIYNAWINPEELAPMPQCIAQQNQAAWLSTVTKCTWKECTLHFGWICTRHRWLSHLDCLSTGFSSDFLEVYLPYCARSVLAKAQLFSWVREITGRTWLVDVGDTNGLEDLSPASLTRGFAAVDVIYKAPTCLTRSVSVPSMEPFQHVMASCSFTATTQHTGNAACPWEYREDLQSMVALDFETVGYNLTGYGIPYGDYFDKECFCSTFTLNLREEPCLGPGQLDLTKERLWLNATCGPTSLPDNWTETLKTTEFAYIPTEDWHWPKCVADMPKEVTDLSSQCTTDACELDSSGYCKVRSAVDRACFCRNISYDFCGGSCQLFETRIDYVRWLHGLCGNVQNWHGLPDNWDQLTAPTALEMIPWQWTIEPFKEGTCASNEWKLGSLALVNIVVFLVTLHGQRIGTHQIARHLLWRPDSWSWFSKGTFIAALQLFANLFNALLVQISPGYGDIPVLQLMLFWCSIPRLAWLPIVLQIGVQPFGAMDFSVVAPSLFAELILQFLSSYYMATTVYYGMKHNFYFGGLGTAERSEPAYIMYAGALLWLVIGTLVIVHLMRAIHKANKLTGSGEINLSKGKSDKQTTWNVTEELMAQLNEHCTSLMEKLVRYFSDKSTSERTLLIRNERGDYMVYGTCSVEGQHELSSQKAAVKLYVVEVVTMLLVWIAQWLFWGGFIGLSSEEFCPPNLGALTTVWIAFSLAGVVVGSI